MKAVLIKCICILLLQHSTFLESYIFVKLRPNQHSPVIDLYEEVILQQWPSTFGRNARKAGVYSWRLVQGVSRCASR